MSRVHDALRRAEQSGYRGPAEPLNSGAAEAAQSGGFGIPNTVISDLLDKIEEIPFSPAPEGHLVNFLRPHEAPTEEFRSLRTRLNHMQSLQPIHTMVVTSPSPAEGKSFTAVNLAMVEANLAGNYTLLADFDFRRPTIHDLF